MKFKIFNKYILTTIYIIIYYYGYNTFLAAVFSYAGFEFHDKDLWVYLYTYALMILPLLLYKEGKISSFISTFVYILLYIPIIFSYTFIPLELDLHIIGSQLSFFIGMCMFFVARKIDYNLDIGRANILFSPKVIMVTAVFLSVVTLIVFRNNIKLVSFEDVYDLREEANKISEGNALLGYLNVWLTNFFMPVCMAYGIIQKKKIYYLVGFFVALTLYLSTGAKIAIIFPLVYFFFNNIFKGDKIKNFYVVLVASLSAVALIVLVVFSIFPDNPTIFMITSILFSRTLANGGMLTFWYDRFFQNHPFTNFSHINFINIITQSYPYQKELGYIIGSEFWNEKMNANANFWATDGVASHGILGILIANILFFLILVLFNTVSRNFNKLFIIFLFLPFISVFLNTSIFTSLLSGGAFLSIIFLINLKKQKL